MNLHGNTILITGGGSGIGRGLAEALHTLGNQVILAGRRQAFLDATIAANPGMHALELDIQEAAGIRRFADAVRARFPELNVLINNAGIMRAERLKADPVDLSDAEAIIATNLLGTMRLTAALLPQLKTQASPAIMNVTSGLAFVPLTLTPTYCATKAALHSWTQSLRFQLKSAKVEVIELIPPYVATDLLNGANDPRAMPLQAYIDEGMEILKRKPTSAEILVERVRPLRFAAEEGRYEGVFQGLNSGLADIE